MEDNSKKQNAKFLGEIKEDKRGLLYVYFDDDGYHICWNQPPGGVIQQSIAHNIQDREDAVRLAACWNACRGIQTEYLESAKLVDVLYPKQPDYFIGTEKGIADIETPPSDN